MQSATRRFSPPESVVDRGVVGRAAERFHRDVDLAVEVPEVRGVDLVLELGHLVRGLVGVVHGEFVVAVEDGALGGDAFHDVAAHVERGVELGLLRQVAHAGAFGGPGLAREVLVEAGHDPQERGLARAVDAHDADLHAGEEVQADVLERLLAAGIGLGHAVHVVDVLVAGHEGPPDEELRVSAVYSGWAARAQRGGGCLRGAFLLYPGV